MKYVMIFQKFAEIQNMKMFDEFLQEFEFGAVRRIADLVDLEK